MGIRVPCFGDCSLLSRMLAKPWESWLFHWLYGSVGPSGARKVQAYLKQSVRLEPLGPDTLRLSWLLILS